VKIFNETERLERTLNPDLRTQPITEGVGRPPQHHKRNRTGGNFREATRGDLDAGGVVGLEEVLQHTSKQYVLSSAQL
jgi:hypothetical protein